MPSAEGIINKLKPMANPDNVKGMAKFGMTSEKRPGISIPEMRKLAKEIREIDSKASLWIASDAIWELESEAVQKRLKKKLSKGGQRLRNKTKPN